MIANVHHGLYPSASKVEKRKVYVGAGNVSPVVGMVQDVQPGSRRHVVRFDEGRTFSLGSGWGWSSGRRRRDTWRRGRRGGRLIQGEELIISGCLLWTGNGPAAMAPMTRCALESVLKVINRPVRQRLLPKLFYVCPTYAPRHSRRAVYQDPFFVRFPTTCSLPVGTWFLPLVRDTTRIPTCVQVCKRFDHAVRSAGELQYIVELGIGGLADGPSQHPFNIFERLNYLKSRRLEWRDPCVEEIAIIPPLTQAHLWKLRAATLVRVTNRDPLLHGHFDVVDVVRLDPPPVEQSACSYTLDSQYTGFEFDPGQDLLVLFNRFPTLPWYVLL